MLDSLRSVKGSIPSSVSIPKFLLLSIGLGIVIGALATSYHFYSRYTAVSSAAKAMNQPNMKEREQLIEKVGKLIELPGGEVPKIATVADREKLVGQAFFARAQNGDMVLIYTNAQKAILYRPESNKIIEVGPVNIATPTPQVAGASDTESEMEETTATPSPTKTVTPTPTD